MDREKLNRSDISEEIYWVWECSKCNSYNDEFDAPEDSEIYICENCNTEFELI